MSTESAVVMQSGSILRRAADRNESALPSVEECRVWIQQRRYSDSTLHRLIELCEGAGVRDARGTQVPLRPVGISEEISALVYWLGSRVRDGITVDTGFGYGVAASFFALARSQQSMPHYSFDPFLHWTHEVGTRLIEALELGDRVCLSRELSYVGLADLYRRMGPESVGLALLDGPLLYEELMAEFALIHRLLRNDGTVLVRHPYHPQVAALLAFVQSNLPYRVHLWTSELAVLQRRGEDRRGYCHFEPFSPPFEGHADALENGLAQITAPDGRPLVFKDETSHQYYLRRVLHGREYPLLFPDVFQAQTILDVGAHVGSAARYFAQQYPQARIVCIEPTPESFALLCSNTQNLPQVERHEVAFVRVPGPVRIWRGRHSSGQNSAVPNEENMSEAFFDVQGVEPLTFCREQGLDAVSILKIDIEGLEMDVLHNLAPLLPRIQVMYVEYHSEALRRQIDDLLRDEYVLFATEATEAFRGTVCYVRADLLHGLMHRTETPRYVYEKDSAKRRS